MQEENAFPQGMEPLGARQFTFDCHPGVACFTVCCRNVDMILYPYDIIRLKTSITLDSEEFLRRHTRFVPGDNPYFPTLMLKLSEGELGGACPFLGDHGCTVYRDRPTACRSYPLERAVNRHLRRGSTDEYYFLTNHSYCLGHGQEKLQTVKNWLRGQRLLEYNAMNELWAEMDTLFATNPWKGEGAAGERQKLAFLVCYNIDGFRRMVESRQLLVGFNLSKDQRRRIASDDTDLLKFGFEWLKMVLQQKSSLVKK
jgi:uncharacterized protein